MAVEIQSFRTNPHCRLADKALEVLHHLARRGSVWPEASATAVRELRDRITQRTSRTLTDSELSVTVNNADLRTNQAHGVSVPAHTSSNSLQSPWEQHGSNTSHAASSTGSTLR